MTKSNLFKRAHEIARSLEGDYTARFSYGLTVAWKEVKMGELKGTEKQVAWAKQIKEKNLEKLNSSFSTESFLNCNGITEKQAKVSIENYKNETSASKIIDTKGLNTTDLIEKFYTKEVTDDELELLIVELKKNEKVGNQLNRGNFESRRVTNEITKIVGFLDTKYYIEKMKG